MSKKYHHSLAFAEVKTIKEDIPVNLTSLQYLQTLDFFLWRSLRFLMLVSPRFFTSYLSKIVAYQHLHPMTKLSSENRNLMSCAFFNYVTTGDKEHIRKMYLNRGLFFGVLSHWINLSTEYFSLKRREENPKRLSEIALELSISDARRYWACFKQTEYWMLRAQDFKSKIMQKYTRMTLLQAQKAYIDIGHEVDLDDVMQIYLQTMSRAIDRCDSRFGVLTTFIQSWLKSAKALVLKLVHSSHKCDSYEGLIESYGDAANFGTTDFDTTYDAIESLAHEAHLVDTSGCLRVMFGIPQFMSAKNLDALRMASIGVPQQ